MSRASLDWSDPVAVLKWLAGLRVAWDNADAIAQDMLRPPRSRELGPALHAHNYGEARQQILQALAFAEAPEPDSDPSGNDGAPPGDAPQ